METSWKLGFGNQVGRSAGARRGLFGGAVPSGCGFYLAIERAIEHRRRRGQWPDRRTDNRRFGQPRGRCGGRGLSGWTQPATGNLALECNKSLDRKRALDGRRATSRGVGWGLNRKRQSACRKRQSACRKRRGWARRKRWSRAGRGIGRRACRGIGGRTQQRESLLHPRGLPRGGFNPGSKDRVGWPLLDFCKERRKL
jgi:hypothetical protein